ncbi:MAG: ferric reductase-like transmembrane domain-containing protein [Armatimonadota bacterium]
MVWILGYAVLALTPLLVAVLVTPRTGEPFLRELGKSFALVGITILLLQVALASRIRAWTEPFGLTLVLRFHQGMAVFAGLLLLAHPILLAASASFWPLLYGAEVPWYLWFGRLALLLLLVQLGTSLLQWRLLRFENWRMLHNQALIIVGLAWVHSWNIGGDLRMLPMRLLWVGLTGVALGIYGYHKWYRPWRNTRRPYRVREVRRETPDAWTLTLAPEDGRIPPILPGQFHFVTLVRGDRFDDEEHPFAVSSSPTTSDALQLVIRARGDFTRTIGRTWPGDVAYLDGPYGRFSYLLHPNERHMLFIADHNGVAPVMSMLRHLWNSRADREVLLLYFTAQEGEVIYRKELEAMAGHDHPYLRVLYALAPSQLGEHEGWQSMLREWLAARQPDRQTPASAYLCACSPQMAQVAAWLLRQGVPPSRIHQEYYHLL